MKILLQYFATYLTVAPALIFCNVSMSQDGGVVSHFLELHSCLFCWYENFVAMIRNLFDGSTSLDFGNISMRPGGGIVSHFLETNSCLFCGYENFVAVILNHDGSTSLDFCNDSKRQLGDMVSHCLEPRPCLFCGYEQDWSIWATLQSLNDGTSLDFVTGSFCLFVCFPQSWPHQDLLSWNVLGLAMLMFPPWRRYHHNLRSTDGLTVLAWIEIVAILVHYQSSCNTGSIGKGAQSRPCLLEIEF